MLILKQIGTDPAIIYAAMTTERVVSVETAQNLSADELAEWNDALDEFDMLSEEARTARR